MVVNTLTFTLSPPASITRTRVPGMPPHAAGDLYLTTYLAFTKGSFHV